MMIIVIVDNLLSRAVSSEPAVTLPPPRHPAVDEIRRHPW